MRPRPVPFATPVEEHLEPAGDAPPGLRVPEQHMALVSYADGDVTLCLRPGEVVPGAHDGAPFGKGLLVRMFERLGRPGPHRPT